MTQQSGCTRFNKALLFLLSSARCLGFVSQTIPSFQRTTQLSNGRFDRDIDDRSRQRAQGQGGGEMAAGAILGGLIGGPFGLLFGAQIGANLGAKSAVDRARQEEMERLGITQEMLDAAQECGLALQQSREGLKATQASLETHQSLARLLDRDSEELFDEAKEAMSSGDEGAARSYLLKKNESQEKLKKVLKVCAEEKMRLETMERNVGVIQQRALEVESLLQRTVGAKSRQDSFTDLDFAVPAEDPLLKKFRDLGID